MLIAKSFWTLGAEEKIESSASICNQGTVHKERVATTQFLPWLNGGNFMLIIQTGLELSLYAISFNQQTFVLFLFSSHYLESQNFSNQKGSAQTSLTQRIKVFIFVMTVVIRDIQQRWGELEKKRLKQLIKEGNI